MSRAFYEELENPVFKDPFADDFEQGGVFMNGINSSLSSYSISNNIDPKTYPNTPSNNPSQSPKILPNYLYGSSFFENQDIPF